MLEKQLIAGFFINPEEIEKVRDYLRPEHFDDLGGIYQSLLSGEVTPFSYEDELRIFIVDICNEWIPSLWNPKAMAEEVIRKSRQRNLKSMVDGGANEADVLSFLKGGAPSKWDLSAESVLNVIFSYAKKIEKGKTAGLKTGLKALDNHFGGLHKSDLIVVAGRPGMGKTAFGLTVAKNVAISGKKVLFFSIEMPADQIITRLFFAECHIDVSGRSKEIDVEEMLMVSSKKFDIPLFINDESSITFQQLRALSEREKPDMILIDYIQLIRNDSKSENRVLEITELTRNLKCLAKDLDIPVMALSQLSRASEKRDSKKPVLSDLRDSGSIEQDADIVLFPYRPWYHDKSCHEHDAVIIVGKNRHGAIGDIELRFLPHQSVFVDR